MNKENNIVPTGLWLLLHYGYYQNIVPLALYKLAKLAGNYAESGGSRLKLGLRNK